MNNSNKLQVKDLINTGLFTAIYFIVITIITMFGYIPIMMPLLFVFGPLVVGISFMLFLTKVKKFGMILIMSLTVGLLLLLTVMSWYSLTDRVIPIRCKQDSLQINEYNKTIDFAYAFMMIYEVENKEKLLKDIFDSLKPNAKFLIAEPTTDVSEIDFNKTVQLAEKSGFY